MNLPPKLLATFFLILAVAGGTLVAIRVMEGQNVPLLEATILPVPKPLPEFSLVDHTGAMFTRHDLTGRWSVLFFGFTHCPDICPATLQQLSIVQTRLEKTGSNSPDIVFISVDPERDTTPTISKYVNHFDASIKGVTGSMDELTKLTSSLGIFFAKSNESGNGYSVDHSAALLVIDKDGNWHSLFSAPHNIDNLTHDIPLLTGEM